MTLFTQNQDVGLEKQLGFLQARIAKEKDKVENIDKKKSDMMDPEIHVLKVGRCPLCSKDRKYLDHVWYQSPLYPQTG